MGNPNVRGGGQAGWDKILTFTKKILNAPLNSMSKSLVKCGPLKCIFNSVFEKYTSCQITSGTPLEQSSNGRVSGQDGSSSCQLPPTGSQPQIWWKFRKNFLPSSYPSKYIAALYFSEILIVKDVYMIIFMWCIMFS